MHEQRIPTVAEHEAQEDSVVLGFLLGERAQRPWSKEEIARELGSDPSDTLNRLYGAGLIHRLEGFAWATRAALRAHGLSPWLDGE
jgi:hypothetical protein